MKLAFSESFKGMDTREWTSRTFYEKVTGIPGRLPNLYNSANVYVDQDGLHIRAERVKDEYWSGWIDSVGKRTWQYGYFEARMRFPNVPGIWSGFFTVNNKGWPPEIDAGEVFRNDGTIQFQVRQGSADYNSRYDYGLSLLGQWHTYGFLWEPDRVIWYIDDKEMWQCDKYSPNMPMALYVILGMGEWQKPDDSKLPATLDIDYVKVWQKP